MARRKKKDEADTADRERVPLSPEEINEAGRELATVGIRRRKVEQEAKDTAASYRKRLKPIKQRQRELEDMIDTGARCGDEKQLSIPGTAKDKEASPALPN